MFSRRVRIRLNGGTDQTFRPGDIIRGTVEYKSPSEDRLSSLTIDFRGVSKVTAGNNLSRKEQVELFHVRETLFQGSVTLEHHKSHVWPFDFIFPVNTGPDRTGLYTASDDDRFDERPHPMPPSLGPDQSEHTRIIYHMYAVAERSHANSPFREPPIVHNIENLRCLPDVLPETIHPAPAPSQSRTLTATPSSKKSLVRSAPEPQHTFALVANLPSMILLGHPIPISFLVRHISDDAPPTSPPTCIHKTTSLALSAHTHRRCAAPPSATATPLMKPWTESRTKRLATDHPHPSASLPLSASIQARKFPTSAVKDWPPSFKSYSVSRSYTLHVDITVRFSGQKTDVLAHFEVQDIVVVRPADEMSRLARRVTSEAPPALEGERGEGEELPSYEERGATRLLVAS